MNPLSFQFRETPTAQELDYSIIEYSDRLNLSVDKKTGKPAIDILMLDTQTYTKSGWEDSDSDDSGVRMLLDTTTQTYSTPLGKEDSDNDNHRISLQALLDTTTITESREDIDQDK
ncbi:MAG TPA: hypothetical protein VNZ86_01410 [Bacteroidia bacterium]|jgi:hypothetical protein|nr:hypothetical protein [Bacteroidia bacterium]